MNWICKIASSAVSEEKNCPWMFSKASFSRAEGGSACHHGEVRLALVMEFGNESDVGLSPRARWEGAKFPGARSRRERGFPQETGRRPRRAPFESRNPRREVTMIVSKSPDRSSRRLASCCKTDTQGKHRHERGDADSDAQRGQGIPQHRFAQVARGEINQVRGFHEVTYRSFRERLCPRSGRPEKVSETMPGSWLPEE